MTSATATALETLSAGEYRLRGPLTVANVAALQGVGARAFEAGPPACTLELSGVAPIDSAGLALLVDWLAAAAARGATLRYLNLPPAARTLARLSEVETLLEPPAGAP